MTQELRRNVFVLGLDDFQRGELETITNARHLVFHQLLAPEVVTRPDEHGFNELLAAARGQLESFDGPVDAIIAHWDFPSSVLQPMLCREFGLPAASLESVIACEHKHWSRIEQQASVPEVVPTFAGFDPFDDDALAGIDLEYPFWIKPVKSHSSQLGFKIEGPEDFHAAIPAIREGIGAAGDPFNEVLAVTPLPDFVAADSGTTCLAEQIVSGAQATVEGTMFQGEFGVHGVFDSPKDERTGHFARYEYPAASLPEEVQRRMIDVCERYLRHIGYDDACWNIEFMWDEDTDQLWLVEVNTRISQSHSDLFAKVDGMSNHEVAVAVALGAPPWMPSQRGNFEVAAKCFLWTEEMTDGVVRRVPSQNEIARVVDRFPETHVQVEVEVGDRLSELRDQSSYRYDLGFLFLGAQHRDDIVRNYEICRKMLPFEIEPVGD
jgi:biotin carboxylase